MALGDSASDGIGSALPSQVGVTSGWALTTDGTVASWASVGGGSLSVGTFGSTPNNNGASASGSTLTLQPADATHPGSVTAAAQSFGGVKTFGAGIVPGTGMALGPSVVASSPTLQLNTGQYFLAFNGNDMYANTPASYIWQIASNNIAVLHTTNFDLTGLGVGGSIKLKSPDGTTYTATIANGGTWSIT